jgi:hypothetical protein
MCSWTLAFGGNKKLVIYITLQTICLLAICLRVRKNVNRGRDITGFLLYVKGKNHQIIHLQGMKDIALPPEGEQDPCIYPLPPYWRRCLPQEECRLEERVAM